MDNRILFLGLTEKEEQIAMKEYYANMKKARRKAYDDFQYDACYNEAIECDYYQSEFDSTVEFLIAESELNQLNEYYQYTKRYVNAYAKWQNKYWTEYCNDLISEYTDAEVFAEERINRLGELRALNNEAIVLMLYRFFERFLKSIFDVVSDSNNKLNMPENDFTVPRYLEHLKRNGIFVPNDLYTQFDEFRLIRNYLVHSSSRVSDKLKRYLMQNDCDIYKNNSITITPRYVEHVFEIIGAIVKNIELEYLAQDSKSDN